MGIEEGNRLEGDDEGEAIVVEWQRVDFATIQYYGSNRNKHPISDPTIVAHTILGEFELEMAFPRDVLGSVLYTSQAISRKKGIHLDAVGLFDPINLNLPKSHRLLQTPEGGGLSNLPTGQCHKIRINSQKGHKMGHGRTRARIPQIKVSLVSNEPPQLPPRRRVVHSWKTMVGEESPWRNSKKRV